MTDTDERMIREIARLCSLPESRVERTVTLLQGGATIPFITRYRKEATGGLDEVQVGAVRRPARTSERARSAQADRPFGDRGGGKDDRRAERAARRLLGRRQIGRPLSAL